MNTNTFPKNIVTLTKIFTLIIVTFFATATFALAGSATDSVTITVVPASNKTLTINKSGAGDGTVNGAGSYALGATATASATADASSTFMGWSGDCTGTSDNTLTMNTDKTCTANFDILTTTTMTGWILPDAPSCIIAKDANSCNVTLSWGTVNPVGTSAITAVGMINVPGNSNPGRAFMVPYSSRQFFLYNNAIELDRTIATASCTAGTSWDGSKCADIIIPPPLGSTPSVSVFASPSTIDYGATSRISWTAVNIDANSCSTPSQGGGLPATGSFFTPALYTNTTYNVTCKDGGVPISGSVVVVVRGPTVDITATPVTILYKTSSVIAWTSTNAASCWSPDTILTGTNESFSTGLLTGTTIPSTPKTYSVTCTGNGSATDSVTVNICAQRYVDTGSCTKNKLKPIYKEI